MKDLLIYIVSHLVDDPGSVEVIEREGEDGALVLELHVAKDDIGKVIGRQGRIAKEIRTVIRGAANREGRKVSVEIAG
ncbi:MAG: KH domain-containing protein [Oscillospiraceae bacterium]|nr:KH domain-containing protein [Oscillospiraceae bacterium]MBQ3878910.1 KH domain-containing protein [Oscillospiraceae bacterium]